MVETATHRSNGYGTASRSCVTLMEASRVSHGEVGNTRGGGVRTPWNRGPAMAAM
jgi:hypothetical protein